MNTITVNKNQLLETLRTNRAQHESDYKEAVEVYNTKAAEWFIESAQLAEQGEVRRNLDLPLPTKFLDEYDQAIGMMEWEVDPQVELTQEQFSQWVMNKWTWSQHFAGSTQFYNSPR